MITEEKIKGLAYTIWEQEGRPDGKNVEHYFHAKQILDEQGVFCAHDTVLATPSPSLRRGVTRRKKS